MAMEERKKYAIAVLYHLEFEKQFSNWVFHKFKKSCSSGLESFESLDYSLSKSCLVHTYSSEIADPSSREFCCSSQCSNDINMLCIASKEILSSMAFIEVITAL